MCCIVPFLIHFLHINKIFKNLFVVKLFGISEAKDLVGAIYTKSFATNKMENLKMMVPKNANVSVTLLNPCKLKKTIF